MKLYKMNVSAINAEDRRWYRFLSGKRIQKVERLKPPQKKAQSIGAELLLRRAVSEITGENKNVLWDTDKNGKLYLPDHPEIYVNLSHSGDFAVCAVHDAPVGVDIQCFHDFDIALVDRFYSAEEREYVLSSDDKTNAFYTVWTKKESLLKAAGTGLTVPLNGFSVLGDEIVYGGVLYCFEEHDAGDRDYKLFVCFASSPE